MEVLKKFFKSNSFIKKPYFLGVFLALSLILVLSPLSFNASSSNQEQLSQHRLENSVSFSIKTNEANAIDPATLSLLWNVFLNGNDILSGQHDAGDLISENGIRDPISSSSMNGQTWVEWFGDILLRAILFIVFILVWLFYSIGYGLVMASEWILGIFYNPQFMYDLGGFTTETFVRQTAQQVANLCNMLYIVFLFYIAIKAFFGSSDTYRLLVKLVIAALLTNFALVFSGVLIDASQVMMYSIIKDGQKFNPGTAILDNMESIVMENTPSGSGTTLSEYQEANLGNSYDSEDKFWEKTKKIFFKEDLKTAIGKVLHVCELMVVTFAMVVTVITITIILLIRIAALWILLIVSPLAITFSAFPPTERWWREWFEAFTKYAFTGPILIFFLWLANKASQTIAGNQKLNDFVKNQSQGISNQSTFKDDIYVFVVQNFPTSFQFFVLLIIIWAGIIIANKFGIRGASSIEGLYKTTRTLGNKTVALVGGTAYKGAGAAIKGSRVGLWTGFRAIGKNRDKNLQKLMSESGSLKAEVDNLEKSGNTEMAAIKKREYTKKQEQIKALESKKEISRRRKNKLMQMFAFTSPETLKKNFATYFKKNKDDYFSDMETALKGYTNYLFNKDKEKTTAREASRETLFDFHTELIDKVKEWRNTDDSTPEGKEKKEAIGSRIKSILDGIAKKTTDDEKIQGRVRDALENEIFSDIKKGEIRNSADLTDDKLGSLLQNTGHHLRINLFDEASKLAEKEALDYLAETKNREEAAKKQKEYAEEIKKLEKEGRFNPDYAIRQILRGSVSKLEQKAIAEHLATSSRNVGKFIEAINKDTGNTSAPNDFIKAIEFLKERFGGDAVHNFLRIAENDASKTNNINQMGWVTFDSILNKVRTTDKVEREGILKKIISGWSTADKMSKVNPIVFEVYDNGKYKDEGAAKVLIKSINFNNINNNEQLFNEINKKIKEKSVKNLYDNREKLKSFAGDSDAFEKFAENLKDGLVNKKSGPGSTGPTTVILPPTPSP